MQLSYLEDLDSQIPAIQVLCGLGWQYLSREEAVTLRGGRLDQVVLAGEIKSAIHYGYLWVKIRVKRNQS